MSVTLRKALPEGVLILSALGLQFGTLPYLDWNSMAGKQLLFSGVLLVLALFVLWGRIPLAIPKVLPLGGFFLFALVGSAFFAHHPYAAWTAIGVLAMGFLQLLVVIQFCLRNPSFGLLFLDGILFAGVAAASLGLYQYVDYLVFRQPAHVFVPYLVPATWDARVTGMYGQPNMMALFLTLSLLAFCYRYVHTGHSFSSGFIRHLRFLPVVQIGLVFFLTQSRNGTLSLVFCFGFLAVLGLKKHYCTDKGERQEFLYFLLSLLIAFLLFKFLSNLGSSGGSELLVDAELRSGSDDGRYVFWMSSLLMFLDHPWLGVGLDNFKFLLPRYAPQAHELLGFVEFEAMGYTKWAHNELLQILCEGGIVAFLPLTALVGLYVRGLWHLYWGRHCSGPLFLYSHLFLLPFVFQSMLSWPLRFVPLMFLFWVLAGVLLAQYPIRHVNLCRVSRGGFAGTILVALLLVGVLFRQELNIGSLYFGLKKDLLMGQNLDDFENLLHNPYSEHRMLYAFLPKYINLAFTRKDRELAARLLPHAERSVRLQGGHWQWYGLSMLYQRLDREAESREAVRRALDLQPTNMGAWQLLHYLNVLEAARKTGRPVESFYPKEADREFPLPPELKNGGNNVQGYN